MAALSTKVPELRKFVDLHRILGRRGHQYGIENHLSLFVDHHPMTNKRALITSKYGIDWSVATEDDMFSVDMESKAVLEEGFDTQYEDSFLLNMLSIHAGTAMHRPDIKCCIHTHPLSLCTLIGLEEPYNKILNVHQNNIRFNTINKIGYDEEYTTFECDEYEKYSNLIGTDNDIIFLANHGVVVTADCVETAFDRYYFLDIAAQIQVSIYNTGKPIKYAAQSGVDEYLKTSAETERRGAIFHFNAAVSAISS